ncbi:glycosyltransferase family 9 protein [Persephonella sp.]
MKIVVWQTAFLGDLILTTPLIKTLKKNLTDSEIHIITKPFGKDVFKNNPFIDKVIIFDKKSMSTFSLIKKLRGEGYNLALSPHRSHRAAYSLYLSKIKKRIGFDRAGFSFLYTDLVEHRFDGIHEIDRNLKLLEKIENYSSFKLFREPEIFLSEDEDLYYEKYKLDRKGYIAVAPGSKWETKRWTVEGFIKVIEKLLLEKNPVVIVGSNEEKDTSKQIIEGLNVKGEVYDLTGKTSLRELFSVIKNSKLLISNDSAPVHIAVAFNTPVVDIYGPTVTDFGFYPYRNGVVIEAEDVTCRPCGLHGHKKCPTGTFECMKKISPDMVYEGVRKFL